MTLDDILIEDGQIAPFSRAETTHSAMGRFGNVLLIAGQTDPVMTSKLGEVIRFYLTNTANTRVFRVVLPGARIKLVGGDSGHVEHERFVDDVILAPSERAVIDVQFNQAGNLMLEHHTPDRVYPLMSIQVDPQPASPSLDEQFDTLRTNPDLAADAEVHFLARSLEPVTSARRPRPTPARCALRSGCSSATGRSSPPPKSTNRLSPRDSAEHAAQYPAYARTGTPRGKPAADHGGDLCCRRRAIQKRQAQWASGE